MQKLCDSTCSPCRGGVDPLRGADIDALRPQVPEWEVVDEHHLRRTFKFKDFVSALAMVNQIGALAEELCHHPTIHFTWGRVTVEIFTHKIDGLHENDFILAARIDQLS